MKKKQQKEEEEESKEELAEVLVIGPDDKNLINFH
jgi:hypothetical protein